MQYVLRTRKHRVHSLMHCEDCKKVLTIGMEYMSGHAGIEKCIECFKKDDKV